MRGVATIALGAVAVGTALVGCYSPHAATGAPCDPALDNCPSGQHCSTTTEGSFCYSSLPGALPDGSSPIDGPRPDNAPNCFGTGLVHDLCAIMPSGDLTISADRTLNTAMVGGTNCDSIVAQPGGGASLCLVTAQHLSIAAGVKVLVTGPNPLVLVGTQSLSIAGTLDGASHVGATDGPGAQTSCGTGTEGGVGGGPSSGPGGGGGGAGGSFGTLGGVGGIGYKSSSNNPGGPGGTPTAITSPASLSKLVGGCPGGRGGYGFGSPPSGDGPAGHGGGALYLITSGTLTISGVVNASGGGGGGGTDGVDCSGGGGGGGAGGFIGLDAPTLAVTGAVYANGGGGGGGGGTDVQFHGSPGNDPSSPTAAAGGGGGGSGGGGNGGNGFAAPASATKGNDGTGPYSGAGGGGGGAGIIRTYGATASGGTFSPTPN